MKKALILTLLSLSVTCLAGCQSADPVNPEEKSEIVKLEITGNINKTEYAYDDEWDYTGLAVNAIRKNNERVKLNSSEYIFVPNVKRPSKLIKALSVVAKYKEKQSITGTRVFSNIKVADEVYDEEAEQEAYYSDCNLTYTGQNLINELHRHSFAKHTNFVLYKDVATYFRKGKDFDSTDLIPGVHNTEFFYTGEESNYNSGTREHVWACNDSNGLWTHGKVDATDYYGGGSDLYHVRPCDSAVNTARGDAPFVDFDDFPSEGRKTVMYPDKDVPYKLKCYKSGYSGGELEFSNLVEPDDSFKGDIARTVAYLYMHYKTNTKTPSKYKTLTGGLLLTSVIGYSTETKCKEILSKWNELDPVSDVEKHRNHVVEQIQGNRNPFVDYPELIDKAFQ